MAPSLDLEILQSRLQTLQREGEVIASEILSQWEAGSQATHGPLAPALFLQLTPLQVFIACWPLSVTLQ